MWLDRVRAVSPLVPGQSNLSRRARNLSCSREVKEKKKAHGNAREMSEYYVDLVFLHSAAGRRWVFREMCWRKCQDSCCSLRAFSQSLFIEQSRIYLTVPMFVSLCPAGAASWVSEY